MTAPRRLQLRRGNTAAISSYVGAPGELVINTDNSTLYVHDGITIGGHAATVNTASTLNAVGSAEANILLANIGMLGYVNLANSIQSAQIASANIGIIGYVNLANSIQSAQIASANIGIIGYVNLANTIQSQQISAANLGMKGYVDSVASQSIYSNVNVKAYTESMGFSNYSNVNVAAYISAQGVGGNYGNANVRVYLTAFDGNILPSANVSYSLGSITHQWKDLFVSNNTIYIGGVPVSIDASGTLLVNGNIVQGAGGTPYGNSNVAAYLSTNNYLTATTANLSNYAYASNVITANTGMKGYVDNQITTIIGSAPAILDTLGELANALGADANLSVTITSQIANVNANITTANLGMKGYVDATIAANIANISIPITYSNANVASYLPTYSGNIAANISKAGYTWTFGANATLTVPAGGIITAPNAQEFQLQAKDTNSLLRNEINLDPNNGTYMSVWSEELETSFSTSDWATGSWVNEGGGVSAAYFTNAENLQDFWTTGFGSFVDSVEVSINNGARIPVSYDGNNGETYGVLLFLTGVPASSPTTITSLNFFYRTKNSIDIDYNDGVLLLDAQSMDLNLRTTNNLDLRAGQNLNLRGLGQYPVRIYTDDTTHMWEFDTTGSLKLPREGKIYGIGDGVAAGDRLGYISWTGNSSGDGSGFNTMRLVPDLQGLEDLDQYIIIDPTGGEPGHIHIRAGGTQDNSLADLYLGGENSHVKIGAGLNPPVTVMANNNAWTFGTNGNLTLPNVASVSINYANGVSILSGLGSGGAGNYGNIDVKAYLATGDGVSRLIQGYYANLDLGATARLYSYGSSAASFLGHDGFANVNINYVRAGQGDIQIATNNGAYIWAFNNGGNLTLPQNSTIGESLEIVTVTLDQFTDGGFPGTQVFTKVSDTLYELSPGGPNMILVSGIWRLKVSTATYYDSTDLETWGTVAGGLPAPVGTLGTVASMNLTVNSNTWAFAGDGTTTFPTNISINYSGGNVQYPRIIADTGKAFSVQAQGNIGSAALSWTVNPDAAGQYAAVAVTRGGGDNLAKVVLTAQSDSGDVVTAKTWQFNQTGTTRFPGGTILAPTGEPITMWSDNYSQLMWENANLTVAPNMAINSNFYVTQNNATLDIGYRDGSSTQIIKSWYWNADGNLKLPSGGYILNSDDSIYGAGSSYSNVEVATYLQSGNPSNISVAGNVTATYFIGNGALLTGIAASSSYGNVQVDVFTNLSNYAYNANVTSANLGMKGYVDNSVSTANLGMKGYVDSVASQSLYGNANVASYLNTNNYSPYSNVNVANYLTTATINTTGNITAAYITGNINITGNVTGTSPNVTLQAGIYTSVFDNQGNVTVPRLFTSGNIQTSGYLYGNGAFLTGIVASGSSNNYSNVNVQSYTETMGFTNYSNVNVAAYLSTNSYLSETTANLSTYAYNANVTAANVGMKGYVDAQVSNMGGSSYGNSNVAAYLTTGINTAAPQIQLTNATSNFIRYSNVGVGAPTFTTSNVGTRIIYWPSVDANTADYAVGIDAGVLWHGIPRATSGFAFKWYAGTTQIAMLEGTGSFTIANIRLSPSGNIVFADGTVQTTAGGGSYSNVQVATYLPTYGGAIQSSNVQTTTANIQTTTAATNTATGALRVMGGIGVAGTVFAGQFNTTGNLVANTVSAYSLNTVANVTASVINAGAINSAGNVLAQNLIGTIATASQTGITAVGTLATLTVSGNATVGNLVGTEANTRIIANSFVSTFDIYGNVSLPNVYVAGNVTAARFIGDGSQLTGINANYSNVQVATYLPTYSGNVANLTLGPSGILTFADGTTQITAGAGNYGNIDVKAFLGTDAGFADGFQRVIEGYYANVILGNTTKLFSFGNSSKSYFGHDGFLGNASINYIRADNGDVRIATNNGAYAWIFDRDGNLTLSGNTFSVNYANGTPVTFSSSSYSNVEVAAYLPTYSGNIANITLNPSGVLTFADGTTQITAGGSSYSNVQVETYLPTYAGTVSASLVNTSGNILSSGLSVFGNTRIGLAGAVSGQFHSVVGNITQTSSGGAVYINTTGNVLAAAVVAGAVTSTGTVAVNAATGITTNQGTFLLANTNATTINMGGAATTIRMGTITSNVFVGGAIGNSNKELILRAQGTWNIATSIDSNGGFNSPPYTNQLVIGGSGTGMTANYSATGGYLTTVTIYNPGTGYRSGDVLSVPGGLAGNTFVLTNYSSTLTGNSAAAYTFGIEGNLIVPGNVTATNFIGNGARLTSLPGYAYSNVNVTAYTESMGFQNFSNVNVAAYLGAQGITAYSNVQVATYLPTYSGNVSALNFVGAIQAQVGSSFAYATNAFGSIYESNGIALPSDNNSNAIVAGYTIVGNSGAVTLTVTSATVIEGSPNFVLIATTPTSSNFAYPVTVYSANYSPALPTSTITVGNATVSGNVSAQYFLGNGALLTGIVASGSNYSNANVAAYLTNYDGDINFTSSVAIISNVDVITVLAHIRSPSYQYSNGVSILSGLGYGNTEVASYLPTYTGNITADTITASGNVTLGTIRGNNTVSIGGPTAPPITFPEQTALSINNTLYGNALGLSNVSFTTGIQYRGSLTASVPHPTAGIYDARIYTSSPQIGANTSITTLIHFSAQIPVTGISSTANISTQYGGLASFVGSASTGSNVATSAGWVANVRNAGNNYSFLSQTLPGPNNWAFYDQGGAQSYLAGNLTIANTTPSTSNVTGALTVAGGVGVGGNLNVGGNIVATGNITAQQFVSTGAGTATLSATTNLDLSANTAVRVVGGGTFRLPQLTTANRDALIAANGDVIYNTTQSKFQTYEGGAWANVVEGGSGSSTYSNVNAKAYTESMGYQNYGNVNVAAYVTTNSLTNYSNVNVASYLGSTQVSIANIKLAPSGNIVFADGTVQTTAGGSSYSNVQVATYLPTYTGVVTAGNVTVDGNLVIRGNVELGRTASWNNSILTVGSSRFIADPRSFVTIRGNINHVSDGIVHYFNTEANVTITNSGQSTSSSTGALVVAGGAGIAKNLKVGANLAVGTTESTANGNLRVFYTTPSTSATTGALVVGGGAGIAGNLHVSQFGSPPIFSVTADPVGAGRPAIVMTGNIIQGSGGTVTYVNLVGNVTISNTAPSTNTTGGALVVTGGAGIGGNINAGSLTIPGAGHTLNGNVSINGAIIEKVFTITDGAAFEIDPGSGTIQLITLTASRTPKATNFSAGESVTLMVDDGTAYTLTWTDTTFGASGVTWVGGTAPTLATTGYTVIQFWKVGSQVYGALVGNVA